MANMVVDARRLLDYAVSRGLVSDASMITAIVGMESELAGGGSAAPTTMETFLNAYNNLSKLTGGVSAESLSPEAEKDERGTRQLYVFILIIVLAILIPVSTITVVGKQLIQDSLSDIDQICNNEPALDCQQQGAKSVTPGVPESGENKGAMSAQITHTYDTNLGTRRIYGRFRILAQMSLQSPPIWAESEGLIKNFHDIRYAGDLNMNTFDVIYVKIAGCLLPIGFAVLGAVAFGLRDLRQWLEARTWVTQGRAVPVLRVVTGGLAGS